MQKKYIGETCRSIRARQYEHKRAIKNMDENHSGISKHVIETCHLSRGNRSKLCIRSGLEKSGRLRRKYASKKQGETF